MQRMAVSRILSLPAHGKGTAISLIPPKREPRRSRVRLIPENGFAGAKRARHHAFSVLSCTTWGLSCPAGYPSGGGLLPRLFTLTRRLKTSSRCFPDAGRFVLCDTFRDSTLSNQIPACSTRHVVWRCSDFPLARSGAFSTPLPKATGRPRTVHKPATVCHPLHLPKIGLNPFFARAIEFKKQPAPPTPSQLPSPDAAAPTGLNRQSRIGHREHITHSPHRPDVPGLLGLISQSPSQGGNMHVNAPVEDLPDAPLRRLH